MSNLDLHVQVERLLAHPEYQKRAADLKAACVLIDSVLEWAEKVAPINPDFGWTVNGNFELFPEILANDSGEEGY